MTTKDITAQMDTILSGVRRTWWFSCHREDILAAARVRVLEACSKLDVSRTRRQQMNYLRRAAWSGAVDYTRRLDIQLEQLTPEMAETTLSPIFPASRDPMVPLTIRVRRGTKASITLLAESREQTVSDLVRLALATIIADRGEYLEAVRDAADRN